MAKKPGVLIVHQKGKPLIVDHYSVRGVAKDYERHGCAQVILKEGGVLDVDESYATVHDQLYDKPGGLK